MCRSSLDTGVEERHEVAECAGRRSEFGVERLSGRGRCERPREQRCGFGVRSAELAEAKRGGPPCYAAPPPVVLTTPGLKLSRDNERLGIA